MAIFCQDFETVPDSIYISEFLQGGRKNIGMLSKFSTNHADFTVAGAAFSANDVDFVIADEEFSMNDREV